MGFMLGNLTIKQLEKRLNITLTEEERSKLESMRQEKANNIAEGKWHCFDIPLVVVCGNMGAAIQVYEILKPYSNQMTEKLQISIENK